jgi:adenosine deaminase
MTGLTRDTIARMPKAELHVHLDGSLRTQTMLELARDAKVALPADDPEALYKYMVVNDARNLEDYLKRFDITVALLQTAESIERVAYEMVEDARRDNVRYLEVRYCPHLSTHGGLTMEQVVEAEARGFRRGERDFGVRTGIINCSLRHYPPDRSIEIAEISVRSRSLGVVGFDLAGGEAGFPPGVHGAAFDTALAGNLGITVHAGEAYGPASVSEAIRRCHAMRIGHGTRLKENPALQDFVRDRRITIETNITSNVQTRVVPTPADHPVRGYFDAQLAVTLCTDSWLMSGTTLTDEYWLAHQSLGFTRKEIERMILNGFAAAFLAWPERQALIESARQELETA